MVIAWNRKEEDDKMSLDMREKKIPSAMNQNLKAQRISKARWPPPSF